MSMRVGMIQTGSPHSCLSAHRRLHHDIGTPSVVCLRVMYQAGESSRKGFGGEEYKKSKKQGGASGKQELQGVGGGVRREDKKRAVAVNEGSRQLQNVLRSVDKETAAQQAKKLGIDPDVAAKGKVDFVRVEAWGTKGTDAELESLKLKSFSPAFSSVEDNVPFYEQLVRRLQLLESKGELAVAQGRPLPPFERWSFGEERYMQFLQDQLAVYRILKDVVAAVKNSRTHGETMASDSVEDIDSRASLAVATFASSLGLDRHEELAADIQALGEATSRVGRSLEIRAPTTQTTAYVKLLEQVGRSATATESGSAEGCLRLLAHIFAIHVAHLTTGMRVGAKAVECLSLFKDKEARAVRFYRDYPKQAQDPLRVLIAALNAAGSYLVLPEEREQVMQELPKAIQRTSLLLSVLAVEEQS